MGDQLRGENCGNPINGHRRDQSLSHTPNGMVQCKASQGMEAHLPSNFDECDTGLSSSNKSNMGDDDQSMVEFPSRHPKARKRENSHVENHSTNISNSDAMRSQPFRESDSRKNVGESSDCNHLLQESACNKNFASVPTGDGIHHSLDRENDGGTRALHDSNAGQRPDGRIGEEDRMEFYGGSEATPSV